MQSPMPLARWCRGSRNRMAGYRVEADVDISPTFFAWCCHFTQGFRIEGPEPVVAQMREHLRSLMAQYET